MSAPITIGATTLWHGDALTVLKTLPSESVHCCVTSPPYYGLRDYGVNGQIGMEATVGEYVEKLVEVFSEVRRVLRGDGSIWINLGDSYAAQVGKGSNVPQIKHSKNSYLTSISSRFENQVCLKPKDLIGIPWRVAFALQADGWWLRSDVIWSKPNPMPESVRDRPTKSHEYLFLLAKSERYFFDIEAVKEDASSFNRQSKSKVFSPKTQALKDNGHHGAGGDLGINYSRNSRNIRSVWIIATIPFSEAHFATFPPKLVVRCIKAGTSERGCCAACGAPWGRVVERGGETPREKAQRLGWSGKANGKGLPAQGLDYAGGHGMNARPVIGARWSASCACAANVVPCTVLDPFAGAGTTLLVADRLQRRCVGIELSQSYIEIATKRLRSDAELFAEPIIAPDVLSALPQPPLFTQPEEVS